VTKNCDFMKEQFPGVKEMAVDTLVKVLRQCSAVLWDESSGVFAREMIGNLDFYASELNHSQTCSLYEAMGFLMTTCPREQRREGVMRLLDGPNSTWQGLIATAGEAGLQAILGTDDLKSLIYTLRCINRVGKTSGPSFMEEMQAIYWQLQELYTGLSAEIVRAFAEQGEAARGIHQVKLMRTAKKEILKTVEYFIASAEDLDFVANQCIPQLFRAILSDYTESVPIARDPQVLAVVTAAVKVLKGHLSDGIATILGALFDSTAELIVTNAEDFPEHRVGLFSLIKAINANCFEAFLAYVTATPAIMSGVLWASKHIEPNTCMAGLDALYDFLNRIALHEEAAAGFLSEFASTIVNDTLVAMLDTMHRPAFKRQIEVLQRLFLLSSNVPADAPVPYSQAGLEETLRGVLTDLPTLSKDQVDYVVSSCFAMSGNLNHLYRLLSDLMVEVQVWNAEQETLDAKAAEREERFNAVEGLARPSMGVRFSELFALEGEPKED
jgi:exportin-1